MTVKFSANDNWCFGLGVLWDHTDFYVMLGFWVVGVEW